jgi:hypothetical protein
VNSSSQGLKRNNIDGEIENQREHPSSQVEPFYQDVLAAYTPEVRLETLELNEAIPIAEE